VVFDLLHRWITPKPSHLARRHRHLDHVSKILFRIDAKGVFTLPSADRWPEILRATFKLYSISRRATIVFTLQRSRTGARRSNIDPCRATATERNANENGDQSGRDVQRMPLTMRLSDARVRSRQTKLIYPNHRLPPWLIEDTNPAIARTDG
jgi:hypothetical protein